MHALPHVEGVELTQTQVDSPVPLNIARPQLWRRVFLTFPAFVLRSFVKSYQKERFENLKKILLVDDDGEFLQTAKGMLEDAEYCVVTGRNGEEGLEIFCSQKEPFHAVISDMSMPGVIGGYGLVMEILRIKPSQRVVLWSTSMFALASINDERITVMHKVDAKMVLAILKK